MNIVTTEIIYQNNILVCIQCINAFMNSHRFVSKLHSTFIYHYVATFISRYSQVRDMSDVFVYTIIYAFIFTM